MTAKPSSERYGVSGVRVLRTSRHGDRYEIRDLTVDIALEGGTAGVEHGESGGIVSAATMTNAVHALTGRHGGGDPEDFALALTHHFRLEHEELSLVRVDVLVRDWTHVSIDGRPVGAAFRRAGDDRTARVTRTGSTLVVEAGITGVRMLKTAHVTFEGHAPDLYASDDTLATSPLDIRLSARWRYGWSEVPYRAQWHQVRRVLFDAFAEHASLSAQHTTHTLGRAVLDQCPAVAEIRLELGHVRASPIDVSRFGLEQVGELFEAPGGARGIVDLVLRRDELES